MAGIDRWAADDAFPNVGEGEMRDKTKRLILTLAFSVTGLEVSSAQTGTNVWGNAYYNGYQTCKRKVSAEYRTCLANREINNPGARYAACAADWKKDVDRCWATWKGNLGRSNWPYGPKPRARPSYSYSYSYRPAYPTYRAWTYTRPAYPTYRSWTYTRPAYPQYNRGGTWGSYSYRPSVARPYYGGGAAQPHRGGGLIMDPAR